MKRIDQVTAFILILALLSGIFGLYQRIQSDGNDKMVQIAMDYDDLYARQDLWQVPLSVYLSELKENGLQAVVLPERTVQDYVNRGSISTVSGIQVLELKRTGSLDMDEAIEFDANCSYIFSDDLTQLVRIQAELIRRLGDQRVRTMPVSAPWGIEVEIGYDSLLSQRTGYSLTDLEMVALSGLDIIPVMTNFGRVSANRFEEVLLELEQYGKVHSVLFEGSSVVGFPAHLDQTAISMNSRNIVLGMIQPADTLLGYTPVAGTEELLDKISYRGARTYMVSRGITNNITTADMISRWINSVKEYNIHILYMRPFYYGSGGNSAAQRNLMYVDELNQKIHDSGYQANSAPSYPTMKDLHPLVSILLMWGIGAAALLLLKKTIRINPSLQAVGLFGFAVLSIMTVYVDKLAVLKLGWALAGAILFPVLAMVLLFQNVRFRTGAEKAGTWGTSYRLWAETTMMTLGGAVVVSALLATNRFILDVDYFRGVKVSYIVPLILIYAGFSWYSVFSKERNGHPVSEIRGFLKRAITFQDLLIIGILLGMLGFYLLRSGNVEITPLEMSVRDWLDKMLMVRPRTKEFLVGHPFLILATFAALAGYRKYLVVLFGLGAIGQISIMNTFMHIRTPLFESLLRTLNGIWLGAVVGILFIAVWGILNKRPKKENYLRRRKKKKTK